MTVLTAIPPAAKNEPRLTSDTGNEVIRRLNQVLKNELTSINQYFLHARVLKHMGFMKLADHTYKESIDEMRHADKVVERILFLGGSPNLQDLGQLSVGRSVEEVLNCDLAQEERANTDLKSAITACEAAEDYGSATLLSQIQQSEEEHLLYLKTQLNLIASMGLTAYLQTQV